MSQQNNMMNDREKQITPMKGEVNLSEARAKANSYAAIARARLQSKRPKK